MNCCDSKLVLTSNMNVPSGGEMSKLSTVHMSWSFSWGVNVSKLYAYLRHACLMPVECANLDCIYHGQSAISTWAHNHYSGKTDCFHSWFTKKHNTCKPYFANFRSGAHSPYEEAKFGSTLSRSRCSNAVQARKTARSLYVTYIEILRISLCGRMNKQRDL